MATDEGLGTPPTSKFLRCQWYVGHPSAGRDPSHFLRWSEHQARCDKVAPPPKWMPQGFYPPTQQSGSGIYSFFLVHPPRKSCPFHSPRSTIHIPSLLRAGGSVMSVDRANGLLRHVRRLLGSQRDEAADGTLLQRFALHADDAAFAALVHRHGPLVWSVSRRVARHEQDAEDVYQATFLLLARKAGVIRKSNAIASWLYGVAHRLALRTRCDAARRRQHEGQAAGSTVTLACDDLTWRELREMLDAELARLPDQYRAPVLLCYFEGLTQEEAARQLGWTKRSVKDRLEHGRNRLRARLAKRGATLSMTLVGSLIAADTSKAAAPAALTEATLQGAVAFARHRPLAGLVSSPVLDLTERGLKTMFVSKLLIATTLILVVATLSSAGLLLGRAGRAVKS